VDPDSPFQVNPDPDMDPIQIQGFYDQKLIKIQLICVGGSFLPSWNWIRIADPDTNPGTLLNPDPIRIGIYNTG
jgi:hypothetical protein